ncbi:MAG: hypothetical protein IBJ07_12170 [Rhizobiaceae bacterium]|nr:hypothetical protein [Rhizobiaceae bacterium]
MSRTVKRSAQMRRFIDAVMAPVTLDPDPVATIQFHVRELALAMRVLHPEINRYTYDPEVGLAMVCVGMKRGTRLDDGAAS